MTMPMRMPTRPKIVTVSDDVNCRSSDPLAAPGLAQLLHLIATAVRLSKKVKWVLSVGDGCDAKIKLVAEHLQKRLAVLPDQEEIREIVQGDAATQVVKMGRKANYGATLEKAVKGGFKTAPGNFLWIKTALHIVGASTWPWNAPGLLKELTESRSDIKAL